ncbi:MAG TPA: hypothetical protein VE174_08645 [Actinomycetota bacterium]|nr:hypothetical protein [Actinomycetota bacterium]
MDNVDHVKQFLRGQNLEQVGRTDEAIELYEGAVTGGFDSTGPYDRLIALYSQRAAHRDVVRVAELALLHVHTYQDKKDWYERMKVEAERAEAKVPQAAPKGTRKQPEA